MHAKYLLPVAAAQIALGQTLVDVLTSQNHTLSTLIDLIQQQPQLLSTLGGMQNITVLAPSNDAFSKLLSDSAVASAVQTQPGLAPALLTYHILNGTFHSSQLIGASNTVFVPTLLTDTAYSTVSGGQRVEVKGEDGTVAIFTGNDAEAKVQAADFNFTGGTVHIIDNVLSIPGNLTDVLAFNKLTSLAGAVTKANLAQPLTNLAELTLFAPNNDAFAAISDVAANLTVEQLAGVLGYHVISGAVVYSVDITNGATATTLKGTNVTLRIQDGAVFVNNAKVVKPDVLVRNGVVHVIDSVLIPQTPNATTTATGTASAPSSTASGTNISTVVPGAAASMGQGVMRAAALVGGAVALLNM